MKRKTNVLLIYEELVASVRLCGYEQLAYLDEAGKINFRHEKESSLTEGQCQWADVVLFIRNSSWLAKEIAKCCKKAGRFIIYALDDDLLDIISNAASAKYYQQDSVKKRIRWFMRNCSVFISPSRHLINKYKNLVKRSVQIEEPCLNKEIRTWKRAVNEKLKIGFAGSIDRAYDVENMLQDALYEFYKKHQEEVEIEFMGIQSSLAEKLGFACYPFEQSYENYQEKFYKLNWDVGLAPMPDTEFHKSKHYNKYIEYGSAGCVGIYSDVIPYRYVVKDKVNGILCPDCREAWVDAMEWCLRHRDLLEENRENVLADMRQNFQLQQVAVQFSRDLPEFTEFLSEGKTVVMPGKLYKLQNRVIFGLEFLSRNKWKSFQKVFGRLKDLKEKGEA